MTAQEQLIRWLNGVPEHNDDTGECCPDFSCCHPELEWPKEIKQKFFMANDNDKRAMLSMSLSRLSEKLGAEIEMPCEVYHD